MNWLFLNDWAAPIHKQSLKHVWQDIDGFSESTKLIFKKYSDQFDKLFEISNKLMKAFKGDYLGRDWNNFRPLRLSREEDWSDWLAHLLSHSSGEFNRILLGELPPIMMLRREDTCGSARADIVGLCEKNVGFSIEVKTGDFSFDKTIPTAKLIEAKYPNIFSWHHKILILDEQLDSWQESYNKCKLNEPIEIAHLTWSDVTIAIRRCMYSELESIEWVAWGYAFGGVIDHRLLNYSKNVNSQIRFIDILERAGVRYG